MNKDLTQSIKKPLHIAFLMRWASGGGAERVMTTLATQLAQRGYRVDFVFISAQGVFLDNLDKHIHIVDLAAKRTLYAPYQLQQYLKKNQPDVLISALNYINVMAVLACKMLSKSQRPALILTEHGTLSAVQKDLQGTGKIVPMLMKKLYPSADKVVAVSQGVADDLQQYIQLKSSLIQTIYNPLDFDVIVQKKDEPLSHDWANDDVPLIVGAGRLVAVKNFPLLIQAFEKVREKIKCRLLILGEGECRAQLQQQISQSKFADDIQLFGFCANPFAWLKRADVFVLSSNSEGLPTILIEALACGASVVSTDCPYGPSEILQNGQWGKLVPVGDVEQMATAIAEILMQKEKKPIALNTLQQRFGVENITAQYEQLILMLCQNQTKN